MTIEQAIKQLDGAKVMVFNRDMEKLKEAVIVALNALREKQERMNPTPLTEDELRQMMGESVWCVYEGGASWHIVSESLFTILNGITAYRYKPGEVQ